ncbi:unnamed protein product [Closterium sp. Yama58-4]|nr:unnamed protein product [Closterium sp. Yama58-4]
MCLLGSHHAAEKCTATSAPSLTVASKASADVTSVTAICAGRLGGGEEVGRRRGGGEKEVRQTRGVEGRKDTRMGRRRGGGEEGGEEEGEGEQGEGEEGEGEEGEGVEGEGEEGEGGGEGRGGGRRGGEGEEGEGEEEGEEGEGEEGEGEEEEGEEGEGEEGEGEEGEGEEGGGEEGEGGHKGKEGYMIVEKRKCLAALRRHRSAAEYVNGFRELVLEIPDIPASDASSTEADLSCYGHFKFGVLPFGLTNAPATFMGLMNDIFRPFLDRFVIVFLDDILIFNKSLEEHAQHLRIVLDTLRQHRLYAKLSKCTFARSNIGFLGHVISSKGIAMDPAKVQRLADCPASRMVAELQSFIGLAKYYRKFIFNFSHICAPPTDLSRQGAGFQ